MIYVEPEFYADFHCTADKCAHSCCVGWEIDIYEATAEYYSALSGAIGEKLRHCTSPEPQPHFILDADERCPFLQQDGLCELILALGEDSLCDICTEHPRFYNDFPERSECGLGLCCEEAVRLLLSGDEPLELVCTSDEDGETQTPELIQLRGKIFDILRDASMPLDRRMKAACAVFGIDEPEFDKEHWRRFYLTLERMDEAWTELLNGELSDDAPDGMEYERLAEYFIYRHFAPADSIDEAMLRMLFSFNGVRLIAALGGEFKERIRLYSAEIEYSDENIDKICAELRRLADKR